MYGNRDDGFFGYSHFISLVHKNYNDVMAPDTVFRNEAIQAIINKS